MCNESDEAISAPTNAAGSEPELLQLNKPLLLAALAAAGASSATVAYEGYGDEGQIENITIENADQATIDCAEHPEVSVYRRVGEYRDGAWHYRCDQQSMTLAVALEEFAWAAIEQHHSGFENGSGGGGEVRFDVAAGTVQLEHREDYTESEYTETKL